MERHLAVESSLIKLVGDCYAEGMDTQHGHQPLGLKQEEECWPRFSLDQRMRSQESKRMGGVLFQEDVSEGAPNGAEEEDTSGEDNLLSLDGKE